MQNVNGMKCTKSNEVSYDNRANKGNDGQEYGLFRPKSRNIWLFGKKKLCLTEINEMTLIEQFDVILQMNDFYTQNSNRIHAI